MGVFGGIATSRLSVERMPVGSGALSQQDNATRQSSRKLSASTRRSHTHIEAWHGTRRRRCGGKTATRSLLAMLRT